MLNFAKQAIGGLFSSGFGKIKNFLTGQGLTKSGKEAVQAGMAKGMSEAEAVAAFGHIGKTSLLGKALRWTGVGAVADALARGKDSILGNLANRLWVDGGKIEAEQNTVGKFHGFFTFLKETLALFGIESEWVNGNLERLGKKDDAITKAEEYVENNITENGEASNLKAAINTVGAPLNTLTGIDNTTAGAVTLGAGATPYTAKKLYNKFFGDRNPTLKAVADGSGQMDMFDDAADDVAKKSGFFSRTKNSLGKALSSLPGKLGIIGKGFKTGAIATATVGTTVGVAGLASNSAEAGTLDTITGEVTTATPDAADINDGLFQSSVEGISNGAHAFAHGFADEISETGASIAGHFTDVADWVSGKALSAVGIDTGYQNRNLSQSWAESADNLADRLLGTPDLSSSFAQAAHATGGLASWLVGPMAFGTAKVFNAGAKAATKLGANGVVAQGAGAGTTLATDVALTPNMS